MPDVQGSRALGADPRTQLLTCSNAPRARLWHIRRMTLAAYSEVVDGATHTPPGPVLIRRGYPVDLPVKATN